MKGIVFLYHQLVMRFVDNGAFDALEADHDITYAVVRLEDESDETRTAVEQSLQGRSVYWLPYREERLNQWFELFNISCYLYRDRSPSFRIRYEQSVQKKNQNVEQFKGFAAYRRHRDKVERNMGLHPEILDLILKKRPDFVVLPSQGRDYITDDVLQLCHTLQIPVLMLVANWDNLSSKGIMYRHPVLMGVWGEQSVRHAVDIQDFQRENVIPIGAPQYPHPAQLPPVDKQALRAELGLPADKRIILFAGTFRYFDETTFLREVEQAITDGRYPNIHILYRPHPWRMKRQHEDNFFDQDWQHVTIDPQLADAYLKSKSPNATSNRDVHLFDMQYLFRLYQGIDAIITPMSTLLLEGMLFGLPIMAIAFGDDKHEWSADKVSQMLHFKELYAVPEVIHSTDRSQFFTDLDRLITYIEQPKIGARLQAASSDLLYQSKDNTYADRVLNLTNQLLNRSQRSDFSKTKLVLRIYYARVTTFAWRVWRGFRRRLLSLRHVIMK
jgi:hypothetical protein